MFDYLKHISELIFDSSKSWGKKTSIIFSVIFSLFIVDFIFNVSYNIFTESKLTQLEKVNILKKDYENDKDRFKQIEQIETDVLRKEHYTEFLRRNIKSLNHPDNNVSEKKPTNNIKLSLFWTLFSSNTFLIFIIFIMLLLPIFGAKENRQGNFFLGMFASLFFLSITISIVTFIAFQIPVINNDPKFNYVLNFSIQVAFYIILAFIFSKKNKKKVA